MSVKDAFKSFLAEEETVKKAVNSSTRASWSGSGWSAEFFDDGTYRILWNGSIGNLYDSPGMVLPIPALSDEEWDEDPDLRYYDDVIELLENLFEEKWQENLEYQYQAAIAGGSE